MGNEGIDGDGEGCIGCGAGTTGGGVGNGGLDVVVVCGSGLM